MLGKQAKAEDAATPKGQSGNESQARTGGVAEEIIANNPGTACDHEGSTTAMRKHDEVKRDMKGAAPDDENSDAASKLRIRLGL